jgi:uncharacterized membrane protein
MPQNNLSPAVPNISSVSNSLISIKLVSRTVKYYCITDEELNGVGLLNTISAICISLGAIFLTLFMEKLLACLENGNNIFAMFKGSGLILLILSASCVIVLVRSFKNRDSTIRRIKEQSKEL